MRWLIDGYNVMHAEGRLGPKRLGPEGFRRPAAVPRRPRRRSRPGRRPTRRPSSSTPRSPRRLPDPSTYSRAHRRLRRGRRERRRPDRAADRRTLQSQDPDGRLVRPPHPPWPRPGARPGPSPPTHSSPRMDRPRARRNLPRPMPRLRSHDRDAVPTSEESAFWLENSVTWTTTRTREALAANRRAPHRRRDRRDRARDRARELEPRDDPAASRPGHADWHRRRRHVVKTNSLS